jgi:enoyl-CoA hydratase/carnithine racemase
MVRSDKHNALDQAMFEGLMKAAEQLADDGESDAAAVAIIASRKSVPSLTARCP